MTTPPSPAASSNPLRLRYDEARVTDARTKLQLKPDAARALFMAEKMKPDFVYHTAALEGNPFTFPEVKTLIEGITVGGHKQSDAEQVLNLNLALSHVIGLVKTGGYKVDVALHGGDPLLAALVIFLTSNKSQAVFDTTCALLSSGFPPFFVSLKDKLIYNQVMTRFYDSQDATEALDNNNADTFKL